MSLNTSSIITDAHAVRVATDAWSRDFNYLEYRHMCEKLVLPPEKIMGKTQYTEHCHDMEHSLEASIRIMDGAIGPCFEEI